MKAEELFHYRDYIKSEYWEERKRQYYATHERKCAVCGHPDVDLHHIKYGNYGRERDFDLAPLCRVHHQELHDKIGVRKDTKYQSRYVIEEAREAWARRFETDTNARMPVSTPRTISPERRHIVAGFIERLARPIWNIVDKFTP